MNVFGVGPLELIVILGVALIFVGPERLPRLAADIARTIREIRKYTGSIAAEFNEVIQDFERETEADRGQWKEIGQGLTDATKSMREAIQGARADAETAGKSGSAPASPLAEAGASEAANGTHAMNGNQNGAGDSATVDEGWLPVQTGPPGGPRTARADDSEADA